VSFHEGVRAFSQDGKSVLACTKSVPMKVSRVLSDLYVVDGLK